MKNAIRQSNKQSITSETLWGTNHPRWGFEYIYTITLTPKHVSTIK